MPLQKGGDGREKIEKRVVLEVLGFGLKPAFGGSMLN